MAKVIWDAAGERLYETGVDHGVLYVMNAGVYGVGVPWNGLVSVTESPSGAEPSPQYADNIKYLNLMSAEEFGATLEAYTYPEEFEACDGLAEAQPGVLLGQQTRSKFGLCYRTKIGNDTVGQDFGYKLHIIWGATAAPSERNYQTVNESPEAITLSWSLTTEMQSVEGYSATALVTIDSTKADTTKLAALEDLLYGTVTEDPALPSVEEVVAVFA